MPPPRRWAVRWWEPFTALGIGTALNLAMTMAAHAAGMTPEAVEPRWIAASAGAAGGLVSALVHISVVCLGAEPPERRDIARAVIEGLFAVIVGAAAAAFMGPSIERVLAGAKWVDLWSLNFGVGMLAWRFAPVVFGALKLLSDPALLRDLALKWLGGLGGRAAP